MTSKIPSRNPFADLRSDDDFEYLCRDLLDKTENVGDAMKLFPKGCKQYGADVVAFDKDQKLVVGQCKRYVQSGFAASKISEAADEFLDHWDSFWSGLGVNRFLLYVSQIFKTKGQLQELQKQRLRFADKGIQFSWVGTDRLLDELRPHPDIVERYFEVTEYYLERICGNRQRESDGFSKSSPVGIVLTRDLEAKSDKLSDVLKGNLEAIRETARSGKLSKAVDELEEVIAKYFDDVNTDSKTEILSLKIRLSFPKRISANEAQRLLDQITSIDSSFDIKYLTAIMAADGGGFEQGLEHLSEPSDVATLNLKLAYLLNLGKGGEVCALYEGNEDFAPNAETKRLYAMALLLENRIVDAETAADSAYEEKPEWEGVRLAYAIVKYHASLATEILSPSPLTFPTPQPWSLVRADSISLSKRLTARKVFEGLLESEFQELETERIVQTWYLATLADDFDAYKDAVAFAEKVLATDPTNVYLLIWVLVRNLGVDLSSSQKELESHVDINSKSKSSLKVNECALLMSIQLRRGQKEAARRLYNRIESRFNAMGEKKVLAYWNAQISIAEGQEFQVDRKFANDIEDVDLRQTVQVTALTSVYLQKQDRSTRKLLLRRLQKLYRKTHDIHYLLQYCQIAHDGEEYTAIIEYADILMERTLTGESLFLVCSAYAHEKLPNDVLTYIEKYKSVFPESQLPSSLRRMKTVSLLKAGRISAAMQEAEKLFEDEKSLENYRTLVEASRHSGKTYNIESFAKEYVDFLTPAQKLHISQILTQSNPTLAADIWRKMKPALREARDLLSAAISQGDRLGLSGEVSELYPQLIDNAEDGEANFRYASIAEVLEILDSSSKKRSENLENYRKGRIPLHLLVAETGMPLSQIFHELLQDNAGLKNEFDKQPVLTRSAASTVSLEEALKGRELNEIYLDVTTLLLAHHLNILPLLASWKPIFLPNDIIPFLDGEIQNASTSLPHRVQAAKDILALVESGEVVTLDFNGVLATERLKEELTESIGERLALRIEAAKELNSTLVIYLPMQDLKDTESDIKLPDDFESHVADWSAVIEILIESKNLGSDVEARCVKLIKGIQDKTDSTRPKLGTKLLLSSKVIAQFAELGVLSHLLESFEVQLDADDVEILKSDVRNAERENHLVSWITGLRQLIQNGFDTELFLGISIDKIADSDAGSGPLREDYRVAPLLQLMKLKEQEGTVFVDDRWLSSYSSVNNHIPIWTCYELLFALRKNATLSDAEFFERLNSLRNSAVAYLPLTSEEMRYLATDYYLREASKEAPLVGSKSVQVPRRYYSRFLFEEQFISKPSPQQLSVNYLAEMNFLFEYQRAILDGILACWLSADTEEQGRAAAELLAGDWYFGRFASRAFYPKLSEDDDGIFHVASDFVDLFLNGVQFLTLEKLDFEERLSRQRAYLDWLEFLFGGNLRAGSSFLDQVVQILVKYLELSLRDDIADMSGADEKSRQMFVQLHLQLFDCLPDVIREKLYETDIYQKELGYKAESVVSLGHLTFDASKLWNAFAAALSGDAVALQAWGSKVTYAISSKTVDEGYVIVFTGVDGKKSEIDGITVALQHPDIGVRVAALQQLQYIFDDSETHVDETIEQIANISEPSERAQAFNRVVENSAAAAYKQFATQLKRRNGFELKTLEAFPLKGLAHYFRSVPAEQELIGADREARARLLLEEVGLAESLTRFSSSPSKLPQVLTEAFQLLDISIKRELLQGFQQIWIAPTSKVHYIHLLSSCLVDDESYLEEIKFEIQRLSSVEAELEFGVFASVLGYVENQIVRTNLNLDWTARERLAYAWSHASLITNIVLQLHYGEKEGLAKLLEFFDSKLPMWHGKIFEMDADYLMDAANPRLLSRAMFAGYSFASYFPTERVSIANDIGLHEMLKKICVKNYAKTGDVVDADFWIDSRGLSNLTGSWFEEVSFTNLHELFQQQEDVLTFPYSSLEEFASSIAEKLKETVTLDSLSQLILVYSSVPLDDRIKALLPSIIQHFDFDSFWAEGARETTAAIAFLTSHYRDVDESEKELLMEYVHSLTNRISERDDSGLMKDYVERDKYFRHLLQIAINVSRRDTAEQSSSAWLELMTKIGQRWSKIVVWFEPILWRLFVEQPITQVQGMGKCLLLARANR